MSESIKLNIADAQKEMRTRYVGGFYGQLVSGLLWLVSACLSVWVSPSAAIAALILGGFFIFPATELLLRLAGPRASLSKENSLRNLGMQAAFVLPLSMPLLLPVGLYRLTWFYPGMMILLGAHYLPFTFLYGMRMFSVLSALLTGGGIVVAMYLSTYFGIGAWCTGFVLIVFAFAGRSIADREYRSAA